MDIPALRVFACVAEHGSITRAALLLDTTQSAVSRQVNALERELGGRLFQRTGRGMALTELGLRLEPRIRGVLVEIERIGQEAQAAVGVPVGDVHVGMLASMAPTLATRLLREVRQFCPQVRVHVFDGFSGRLNELLADGRLDMALLFRYGDAASGDESLGVLHSYLIGPPGDRLTQPVSVAFRTLHELPLVLPTFPNGVRASLDQLAREQGVALNTVLEADSMPVQLALVADADDPVHTVASYYAVAEAVAAGRLQAARLAAPGLERVLSLVRSNRRPGSLATRTIAGMLARLARERITLEPPI